MKALKTNKFRVGDEVVIVKLDRTMQHFGGEDFLCPVGTKAFVTWVAVTGEEVEIDTDMYSYHADDLVLVNGKEEINASQNESIDLFFESDVLLPKNDEDDFTCCLGEGIESKPYNPLVAQEGGGHYKNRGIQPLEYTMKNNLSFCEGNVVKYISRYKSKNGIEDLAKVIHYALLAAYEEYGEQGSTELKEKVLKLLGEHE